VIYSYIMRELAYLVFSFYIHTADRIASGHTQFNVFTQFFVILFSLCSNAVIQVEIQNEGEDAFKPEIYGHVINVERRISESASSTTLKDHQGVLPCVSCFFQY